MNDYNYAKLGTSCYAISHAITSNTKFLPPFKPIYYQPYTYSLQYPASQEPTPSSMNEHGEVVQNRLYFGKDFGPPLGVRNPSEYTSGCCKRK